MFELIGQIAVAGFALYVVAYLVDMVLTVSRAWRAEGMRQRSVPLQATYRPLTVVPPLPEQERRQAAQQALHGHKRMNAEQFERECQAIAGETFGESPAERKARDDKALYDELDANEKDHP